MKTVDTVRLDEATKKRLNILKRRTGIGNWNILCRWAFCLSLTEPNRPREILASPGDGVEMSWKVFAGEYAPIYAALLNQRCEQEHGNMEPQALNTCLKEHITRGVGYLLGKKEVSDIAGFIGLAIK